jgi:secreted Zn-dependent insulinase-like peptidase
MNFFDELKTKLQEHNSSRFNSQKENIMQAIQAAVSRVKPVAKSVLINDIYEPALTQKSDKVKLQEANTLTLQKENSFNRFLEAYGDCV